MIATEKKVTIPANNSVLKVGRERIKEIFAEVILKNMNLVLSRVKRFVDIDGGIIELDEV